MRPLVTVSVVTGRSPEDLRRALESLRRAAASTRCRVVVVDNLATYDAPSVAKACGMPFDVLRNERRRGFGDNHNRVLAALDTPYALIMNDDLELAEGCVDRMVDCMERTRDAGAAGCALHGGSWSRPPTEGGGRVEGAWSPAVKLLLALVSRRLDLPVGPEDLARWRDAGRADPSRAVPLDYISGACCLLRADALRASGLFDTGFYMYLEDVDLGRRLTRAGWRCYQAPGARALHRAGRSGSSRTPRWMWSSAIHYAEKYNEPATRLAARFLEPFAGPRG